MTVSIKLLLLQLSAESICVTIEGDEDWSRNVEISDSSLDATDKRLNISTENRIPDFGLFFTSRGIRTLPILVEIKPYHETKGAAAVSFTMNHARTQTEEQARFAFDQYPLLDKVYIVLIVGFHWAIREIKRRDLQSLPSHKVGPTSRRKRSALPTQWTACDTVYQYMPRQLLNDDRTDYSEDFKQQWGIAMRDLQLTTDWS